MKRHLPLGMAVCLFCMALIAQTSNPQPGGGANQGHQQQAALKDGELRDKLVGVWSLSVTNPMRETVAGQFMRTETQYRTDGTFIMNGQLGMIVPTNNNTFVTRNGIMTPLVSSTNSVEGSGTWRVAQGCLYWTVTKSGGTMQTNVETGWLILSLTQKEFSYQRKAGDELGQVLTATRKQ